MEFWNLFFKKKAKKRKSILQGDRFKQKDKNNCQLRTELISMLNGDWRKADELISRARFCDPRRSYNYYCYKAIINWKKNNILLANAFAIAIISVHLKIYRSNCVMNL